MGTRFCAGLAERSTFPSEESDEGIFLLAFFSVVVRVPPCGDRVDVSRLIEGGAWGSLLDRAFGRRFILAWYKGRGGAEGKGCEFKMIKNE